MTYRVVQWATGAKGMASLREIVKNPDLELVGLRVYDPAKIGRDAGDIAGLAPTGVIATDQIEDILKLDADCVVYMAQVEFPMDRHDDNICRLLRSGKNVVAMTGYYWPATHGQDFVAMLEAACHEGGSTLFGTGFSPGLMTERLAIQMTEACTRVDSIHYLEVCDCSLNKETQVIDVIGCGKLPEETSINSHTTDLTTYYHYEALDAMASAMGVELEDKRAELDTAIALEDEVTPGGVLIRKGMVGAVIRKWVGYRKGKPFITSEHRWTVASHIPGLEPANMWQITIEGRPAMQMQLTLAQTYADEMPDDVAPNPTFEAIMATVIRAIPAVCHAPPGIMKASVFSPWTERMR